MDVVRARLIHLADLQWGRVSWRQLRDLGATERRISHWHRDGYVRQVLPRVYAVGHVAESVQGDLIAAILYAGPGAMLSHATALWWHSLLEHRPPALQVSTPRKYASQPGIRVYGRRAVDLVHHRRLPTTTTSQALLDFAATAPLDSVMRALAEADYHRVTRYGGIARRLWVRMPRQRDAQNGATAARAGARKDQERTRASVPRALPPRRAPSVPDKSSPLRHPGRRFLA